MATYISHPVNSNSILPFIVNILPHLTTADASQQLSVLKAIER